MGASIVGFASVGVIDGPVDGSRVGTTLVIIAVGTTEGGLVITKLGSTVGGIVGTK